MAALAQFLGSLWPWIPPSSTWVYSEKNDNYITVIILQDLYESRVLVPTLLLFMFLHVYFGFNIFRLLRFISLLLVVTETWKDLVILIRWNWYDFFSYQKIIYQDKYLPHQDSRPWTIVSCSSQFIIILDLEGCFKGHHMHKDYLLVLKTRLF